MDFEILIHQHLNWKALIESLFDDDDCNIINSASIAKDSDCDLGKWINSVDSEAILSCKAYQLLQKDHINFHLYAGRIILDYQSGNIESAKLQLPLFNQFAHNITEQLQELKKKLF